MERHTLQHTKVYETNETKEILDKIEIKEEEIQIHTLIYEKSHESLCLNDNVNSIPFCNILLSKFLDLTHEQRPKRKKHKLQDGKKEVDIQVAINKDKTNSDSERQKRFRQEQKMKKQKLQDGQEEVDIQVAINKAQTSAERQKRYRQRQKRLIKKFQDGEELLDMEVAALNKHKKQTEAKKRYKEEDVETAINRRKKTAERMKRFRQRIQMLKKKLQDGEELLDIEVAAVNKLVKKPYKEEDVETAINRRKKTAERQKRYRQRQKMLIQKLQDGEELLDIEVAALNKHKTLAGLKKSYKEVDRETAIDKRKKASELKRRLRERKKKENPVLYAAKRAEAQRLYRLKKKELQDVNEEVHNEVASIEPEIHADEQNQ